MPLPTCAGLSSYGPDAALGLRIVNSNNQGGISAGDRYVRHAYFKGVLSPAGSAEGFDELTKQDTTFVLRRTTNCLSCVQLQSVNYPNLVLRAGSDGRLLLQAPDATSDWIVKPGLAYSGVSFESRSMPGAYLRVRGNELWVDTTASSEDSNRNATFCSSPAPFQPASNAMKPAASGGVAVGGGGVKPISLGPVKSQFDAAVATVGYLRGNVEVYRDWKKNSGVKDDLLKTSGELLTSIKGVGQVLGTINLGLTLINMFIPTESDKSAITKEIKKLDDKVSEVRSEIINQIKNSEIKLSIQLADARFSDAFGNITGEYEQYIAYLNGDRGAPIFDRSGDDFRRYFVQPIRLLCDKQAIQKDKSLLRAVYEDTYGDPKILAETTGVLSDTILKAETLMTFFAVRYYYQEALRLKLPGISMANLADAEQILRDKGVSDKEFIGMLTKANDDAKGVVGSSMAPVWAACEAEFKQLATPDQSAFVLLVNGYLESVLDEKLRSRLLDEQDVSAVGKALESKYPGYGFAVFSFRDISSTSYIPAAVLPNGVRLGKWWVSQQAWDYSAWAANYDRTDSICRDDLDWPVSLSKFGLNESQYLTRNVIGDKPPGRCAQKKRKVNLVVYPFKLKKQEFLDTYTWWDGYDSQDEGLEKFFRSLPIRNGEYAMLKDALDAFKFKNPGDLLGVEYYPLSGAFRWVGAPNSIGILDIYQSKQHEAVTYDRAGRTFFVLALPFHMDGADLN